MSNQWFRFYADSLHNKKVQKLPPSAFKFWVNILCLASQNDGLIPDFEEIAFQLRMKTGKVREFLGILMEQNLIDDGDALKPHNWEKRQYKSDTSADRTRQYRERLKQKCDDVVTSQSQSLRHAQPDLNN